MAVKARKSARPTRLDVVRDHREQWRELVNKVRDDLQRGETDAIKGLKVYAETLKIIHEGERRAWGIDETTLRPGGKTAPKVEVLCGDTAVDWLDAENDDENEGDGEASPGEQS